MPSTLVHLAIGALIAAALLGPSYDRRALAIVLAATALPDLDTILGLWWAGAHRTLLHTAAFPLLVGLLMIIDHRRDERSVMRRYLGSQGPHIMVVAWVALVFAGIAPDLMTNGVNLFYPFVDRYFVFAGDIKFSTQRGLVQTFVSFADPSAVTVGSSGDIHYSTGVDPTAGAEPKHVERVFLIINSGLELLLVLLGVVVTALRLRFDGDGW